MKVLDFPLSKITLCFILGILVSYYCKPTVFITLILFGCCSKLFSILYFWSKKRPKLNSTFALTVYLISFFTGIITLVLHTDSNKTSNYIHSKTDSKNPEYISLTLHEKLKSNLYNDRYIAIINSIDNKTYSGKVIVNIQKDSTANPLIIGNSIRVKTTLYYSKPSKNPNQFDYGKYLSDKQIYAQVYCRKSKIEINKNLKKDIWYYSGRLHSRILRNLEKANFNKPELNVSLALILGQRQEISSDIIQDYQYSGATHILSVSGLHVGFIMLFISFLLKPIPNTRKGSAIKLIFILLSLISFAVISGLSPSVLRSVVMFSILAIGNHLRRSTNIYHTLLVSILLILLFEPYFLFEVGFQLSYLALFFILWLQPLLKKIWSPKNKIVLYIWDTLTVSFAAQIGTLPLCLYYFHQFPGLFFITNIIILPILSFIMIAGIIVMLFAVFSCPPSILVQIFEKSIFVLNKMIHFVASFESFVIRDISFNFYYLLAFYLLIISSIIWLKKPDYIKLTIVLSSIILLQLSFIYTKRETEKQQEFIVYNAKQQTLISERTGSNIKLFTTDTLLKKNKFNQVFSSYLVGNFGILKENSKLKNMLFFKGEKILVIDSSGIYETKINPDIIILTQSPKINLDRMLENIKPKIIVADASNSYSILKNWEASCIKKNIPFHATSKKGFYKLN
ncbi:ComEC/Rec2 family competence protein [Flavobacterium sp. MC2016-06]|jgi:competence protein ComEC|uniref:ComEC/Rec2 family competence protein n=1 Tax=Flavobacterium sp. MC2016-06 TaxID=2676308 RepID=UPI0012BAB1D9|nr:ComEC/Rec2 family competence protein [Flavobacterium sp. MC2016-06]MBU3857979.1 ComEC family competence protein [Flavobacterium sp. MC2016-06]